MPFFGFCQEDDGDSRVYPLAYTKPLAIASMIALQVVRTSFEFHLRECMGSCFPPPSPVCTISSTSKYLAV